MKLSFVSDLHLDPTTPARFAAFSRLLRRESARCDELYVLGDLTEVWIGDDDDSHFADRLRAELAFAAARCHVRLMHGNRDFLFGRQLAGACGIELIDDPSVVERCGVRLLLAHGDAFCTADVSYQRTRAVMRSPSWQRDVLARPLADRRALAKTLRAQSRADQADLAEHITDATPDAITEAAQMYRVDAIVHGHTHRPGIHPIDAHALRYVLGDWDRCGWLLRFDGRFELLRFALADADRV